MQLLDCEKVTKKENKQQNNLYTPGSMNRLFGDFFKEFWRGVLGCVRDYLGVDLGRFLMEN